jgi:hypothetical protein
MSRDHVDMRPCNQTFIDLEVKATDSDLETFLHAKLDNTDSECLNTSATRSTPLRQKIISTIISSSKGMFLLADLQFAQLEDAISEREIHSLLKLLPEEIDEQYRSYFSRIQAHMQGRQALRAIAWIHLSCNPLTSDELLEALAVQPGDTHLDPTGLTTIERLLNITGGLVTFEKESKIVRLVHETLQDFLTRSASTILMDDHLSIAKTLATYLDFATFSVKLGYSQTTAWAIVSEFLRDCKLLKYAFLQWGRHIQAMGNQAKDVGLKICHRISSCEVLAELISTLGLIPQFLLT